MQLNYTTINHNARLELELTLNEYCLLDLIYNLQNAPTSRDSFGGWCYASKNKLGEYLGVSEQTIHTLLRKLENRQLIQKNEAKHLRTFDGWFEAVQITDTKESLVTLKKVESDTKESLVQHTKESLDNKDIYNKDNTNILTTNVVKEFGNSDINEVIEYFKLKLELPILDGSVKQNRYATKRLLVKSKNNLEAVKKLIDCLAVDSFHAENASSITYLEKHAVAIMSRARRNNKVGVVI